MPSQSRSRFNQPAPGKQPSQTRKPASKDAKRKKPQNPITRLVSACKRIGKQIAKAQAQLRDFEQKDVPAWHQWAEETFAKERREIAELEEEHDRIVMRLRAVETLMVMGSFRSRRDAYQEVLRQEKDGRDLPDDEAESTLAGRDREADGMGEEADFGFGEGVSIEDLEDDPFADVMVESMLEMFLRQARGIDPESLSEEEFQQAKEQFIDTMKHAESGDRTAYEKAMLQVGMDNSAENRKSVKAIYRRLAKRLHPDQNGEGGELEKAFWEEVQLAYQAKDAAALEAIELRYRLESGEPMGEPEKPALSQLERNLATKRRGLQADLRMLKRKPAWNFSGLAPEELQQLQEQISMELDEQKADYQIDLDYLRREEARWANPQKQRKPKKKAASAKRAARKKAILSEAKEAEQMEIPF